MGVSHGRRLKCSPGKIFLFGAAGTYFFNRFLLKWLGLSGLETPYLNDLLCLPLVLASSLWLQQGLFPRSCRQKLHASQVVFTVLYISVLFEWVLPAISARYTRDYWDMVAYALGGALYFLWNNSRSRAVPAGE